MGHVTKPQIQVVEKVITEHVQIQQHEGPATFSHAMETNRYAAPVQQTYAAPMAVQQTYAAPMAVQQTYAAPMATYGAPVSTYGAPVSTYGGYGGATYGAPTYGGYGGVY